MKDLYNTNADFKRYVDTYSAQSKHTLEETLQLKVVQLVGEYYRKEAEEDEHRIRATNGQSSTTGGSYNCS